VCLSIGRKVVHFCLALKNESVVFRVSGGDDFTEKSFPDTNAFQSAKRAEASLSSARFLFSPGFELMSTACGWADIDSNFVLELRS
jgi:hypothetical protein